MTMRLLNTQPTFGQPDPLNPPLTIPDLAREVGHGQRTIRRWISQRNITPAGKVGRAYYYWLSDILIAERDTRENQLRGLRNTLARRVA